MPFLSHRYQSTVTTRLSKEERSVANKSGVFEFKRGT
jgi:hypothetical protein